MPKCPPGFLYKEMGSIPGSISSSQANVEKALLCLGPQRPPPIRGEEMEKASRVGPCLEAKGRKETEDQEIIELVGAINAI